MNKKTFWGTRWRIVSTIVFLAFFFTGEWWLWHWLGGLGPFGAGILRFVINGFIGLILSVNILREIWCEPILPLPPLSKEEQNILLRMRYPQ